MSQKTNPTSLRLHKNNQNFSCQWFSDFFFTENYHYGCQIENYLESFLKQAQYSKAFFSIRNQYKNFSIFLLLQDYRADKKEKELFFKCKSLSRAKSLKDLSKTTVFQLLHNNENYNIDRALLKLDGISEKVIDPFADTSLKDFGPFLAKLNSFTLLPTEKKGKDFTNTSTITGTKLRFVRGFDSSKATSFVTNLANSNKVLFAFTKGCRFTAFTRGDGDNKQKKAFLFLTKQKHLFSLSYCNQKPKWNDLKVIRPDSLLQENRAEWNFKNFNSLSLAHLNSPKQTKKYWQQFFYAWSDYFLSRLSAELSPYGEKRQPFLLFSILSKIRMSQFEKKIYEESKKNNLEKSCLNKRNGFSLLDEHQTDFRESFFPFFLKTKQREQSSASLTKQGFVNDVFLSPFEAARSSKQIALLAQKSKHLVGNKLLKRSFFFQKRQALLMLSCLQIKDLSQDKKLFDLFAFDKQGGKFLLCNSLTTLFKTEPRIFPNKILNRSLGKSDLKNVLPLISSGSLSTKLMPSITRSISSLDIFDEQIINQLKKKESIMHSQRELRRSQIQFFREKPISLPYFPTAIDIQPIRFIRDDQNVLSLLNQIVLLLENRVAFRQIKSFLFKQIVDFGEDNSQIKGIRFLCSGRLGGRSKKAQKAKVQSASWGQTSLSAFSSRLLFGSRNAYTSYGQIGVKLWVCLKSD